MSENENPISTAARALGQRAAGVPKKFTPEELERRRVQMTQINSERQSQVAVAKGTVRRIQVSRGKLRKIP